MSALVFGSPEADPRLWWEPLCDCGHLQSEHYNSDGNPPEDDDDMAPCWAGWTGDEEGCECLEWAGPRVPEAPAETPLGETIDGSGE